MLSGWRDAALEALVLEPVPLLDGLTTDGADARRPSSRHERGAQAVKITVVFPPVPAGHALKSSTPCTCWLSCTRAPCTEHSVAVCTYPMQTCECVLVVAKTNWLVGCSCQKVRLTNKITLKAQEHAAPGWHMARAPHMQSHAQAPRQQSMALE